jgi:uncharacterized membrane protein YhaH (DUF805 family)
MIKDVLVYLVFYTIIGTIHFVLLPYLPVIKPFNDFYIMYFCLFIVSLMGSTLFYLNNKLEASNFAGMFMVFTTIQLLACMSFALAIKLIRTDDAKVTLLHFVSAFFAALVFQTIYLLKVHNKPSEIV